MVKFFTGNNPSPYVSDAYKGKLPLGRVRAEMEKRGLAWTPEIEAKLFRVAGDLVFDDTLPEEPLIDADPAGAFAGGLTAGATGNRATGGFFEDPVGNTAHLAGMLMGAGKTVGAVRTVAPKIPGIVASGLGMGAYSGVDAAGSGASAGDVAKSVGIGALTGGALHAVNMIPGALTYPGQAAVFGGMEAMGGGSLQDVLAAAALGPLAAKAVGGFPGRRLPGGQEYPVMPPEEAPALAALPGGSVRPSLMLPAVGEQVPLLQRGQGESAISLPGDISPVGEARMESRPWELVPVPDKVQEPLPRPDVTPEGNAARRRRVQEASRPTRPVLAKPDQPDYKSISEAVPPADLEAVGIIPPQAEQPLTRAQRREAISKVMRRPRPLDIQKAAVEDSFAKAGYEPVGDNFGAASEAVSSAAGLVRSRRSTVANRSDIVAPESPVANDLPDQGPITQPKPRVRLKRSSGAMAGAPKLETAASTDYEPLGGIDYRNRKTGEIVTKIGEDYVPATPEYAARLQQKAAGLSRQKATGEPVIKDVTLGSGLGGAQGAIKGPKFDAPAREVSSGNGVDIGAERYRKSGDIADWARSTATLKVSDKFTKEIAGLKDVRPGEYSFGGRKYALQGLGGGKLGSAVERDILWPNLNAELARDDFMNTWKLRARSVVEKHKIKGRDGDLFVRGQDPAHAQDADVKAVHALLREIRSEHNTAMAAIGGKQMGDVGENYIPRIKKSGMLDRILERQVDESVGNEFSMLHATEKANARAMHRTGRDGEYETDVRVLMDRYIESAAKAIFNNPVIQQNRLHADALEAAGLKGGAELVRNYTDVVWADKPTKLDREMNDWPRWARVAFRSAPAENKHLLNKAVFTMNLAFNLGVQPASVVNTVARYGFRNSTKGLFLSMNPEFRRWTWENTRSGRAKREAGENLVAEGEARGLSVGDSSKPPSLGDKAERWATWTTSVVERAASAHGAASAYYDGKARGFTGRKLREWMNDGISKTQEDYFRAGLPGNLQNRAAPGWVGFYTYFNGMLNMGRELSGISKTGHYAEYAGKTKAETVAKRMRYAVRFVVAAALYDELSHAITGRRPHREVVTGNFEGVMPGGAGLIPYSHAEGLQQAMAQSLRYDTGEPLIKWATSRYAKGGVFFNRMWQTAKAEEDNLTVRDVRGNRKYQYEEDERWKAWLFGTGSTRDGSEYNARYMKGDVYKALEAETNDEPRRYRKPGKPSGPPKPRRP